MLAKKTRKILSLALVLVMVISMFPMMAMADDETACPHCEEPAHEPEAGYTWEQRTTPATYSETLTCTEVPHSHTDGECIWEALDPDNCLKLAEDENHVCSEAEGCDGICLKLEHIHTAPGETACYMLTPEVKYCEKVSDVPPAPGSLRVVFGLVGSPITSVLVTVNGTSKSANKNNTADFSDLAAGSVSVWVSYTGSSGGYNYAYYKIFAAEIEAGKETVLTIASTADFITSYNHIDAKVAAAVTHDADGGNWGTLTFTRLKYTDARDGSEKEVGFSYSSDRKEYYTSGLYATRDYATFTFTGTGFSGSKTITVYNNEQSNYPANTFYNGARANQLTALGATLVTTGEYAGKGYYDISGLSIYKVAQRLCDNYGINGEAIDFALSPATIKQIYEAATLEVTKVIAGGTGGESLAGFKFQLTGVFATAESVGTSNPVPEAQPRSVELTTGADGKVLFENLLTGHIYILREIELPGNYTHIGQLEIPIYKGQTQVARTYTNTAIRPDTGTLKIFKNVESSNLAAGIHTFYFKVSGDNTVYPISVDVALDGTGSAFATIPNLDPDQTYTVTEVDASGVSVAVGDVFSGEVKILDGSILSVESDAIVANQTTEVTLLNKMGKDGTLTINKTVTGVDAGDLLPSYSFTVTSTAAGSTPETVVVTMSGTNGSNSISLTPGSYTVAEVTADGAADILGYDLTEPANQTITVPAGGTQAVNFVNAYSKIIKDDEDENIHADFTIEKVDQDGEPLAGVGFTLYKEKACTTVVGAYTTDANGEIAFTTDSTSTSANYLAAGTYYLKETGALPGYNAEDVVWELEVGNDGGVEAKELEGGGFFYKIYTWFIKVFRGSDPADPDNSPYPATEGNVLTVTNTRLAGDLEIAKIFDGITAEQFADADGEIKVYFDNYPVDVDFSEYLEIEGDDVDGYYVILNDANDWNVQIQDLPTGDYELREDTASAAYGSYNLSVSYSFDGGADVPSNTARFTLNEVPDAEYADFNVLTFTNNYSTNPVIPVTYTLTEIHIGLGDDGNVELRRTTSTYYGTYNYSTSVGNFTGWEFYEWDSSSDPVSGTNVNRSVTVRYFYEPDTDIPEETDPLGDGVDIPDETDPLGDGIDIPDDLDPLGDAPKTGDGNNVFALLAIMISCAFGLVIINLPRKKRNEA